MVRSIQLICASSVLLLSGCSYFYGDNGIIHNRDTEYLSARTTPPLIIPHGLSSSTIETHYPVSDRNDPENLKQLNLVPPELGNPENYKTVPKADPANKTDIAIE